MSHLYRKYCVQKVMGETDPDAQYFVLRIDKDPAARKALMAYILAIQESDDDFAEDLVRWLFRVQPASEQLGAVRALSTGPGVVSARTPIDSAYGEIPGAPGASPRVVSFEEWGEAVMIIAACVTEALVEMLAGKRESIDDLIVFQDGKPYVKYDSMGIHLEGDATVITLMCDGKVVASQKHEYYIDFRAGATLSVGGLKGMLPITFSA